MSATTEPQRPYTPEDLLTIPDGDRYELVDGRLVEPNPSVLASIVTAKLTARLGEYCHAHEAGWTFSPSCLYRCFPWRPLLVRKPDASFIRRDRLSFEGLAAAILDIAPDLAVEVVSPNDEAEDLQGKVRDDLRAGTRLVWVVFPKARAVRVHRADKTGLDLDEVDPLPGEDVLPGFSCRVGDLFPPAPPAQPPDPAPGQA
jgi:Uma2 family endonuclease